MNFEEIITALRLQKGEVVIVGSAMKGLARIAKKSGLELNINELIN
jgi:hypothetical protein